MAVKKSKPHRANYVTETKIVETLARAKEMIGSSLDRIRESKKAADRTKRLIEESHRTRKRD
jgi:hypothetical protein